MIFQKLIKLLPSRPVLAHCDIPCGIYDPYHAQLTAHTILRMTKLMEDLEKGESAADKKEFISQIARMTRVREEHAEHCEREVVTLFADYFKEEHFSEYPELKDLIYKTLKLTGQARIGIHTKTAEELLVNIQKIAEIFWKSKGMEPVRIPSGYPTEREMVSHK